MPTNPTFLPAFAKGPVVRPTVPSRFKIQKAYHDSMEQGRFLEKSIGDAIYDLKEAKKDLEEKVKATLRDITLGTDGQFPDKIRSIKYVVDVVKFLKEMKDFIDEIVQTIQALIQCIQLLTSILNNMKAMIQGIANALANLLAEICNWNLPDLPALPYLLGGLAWGFPGFNLQGALPSFNASMKFNVGFTFPTCRIKLPDFDIFRNYPSSIKVGPWTLNNQVVAVTLGEVTVGTSTATLPISPTLGGPLVTPAQQVDPAFIRDFLQPTGSTPFFPDDFSTMTDIVGSLPNAAKILNRYEMPSSVYRHNVASLVPLSLDSTFKESLRTLVTLEHVYDLLNPHTAAAWVMYLDRARSARSGKWIPEYQAVFDAYIKPSVEWLNLNSVPYNGFDPAAVQSTPDLPLIQTIQNLDQTELWKLSYVEASLLAYTRTRRWDQAATPAWFGYTSGALDYTKADTTGSRSIEILLDSDGQADYPTLITVNPVWVTLVQEAINLAALDILNDASWRSSRPQYRFIYDQFGMATEVDRFSQFWREWKANYDALVTGEDSSVLPYILNYTATINSRVNPKASRSDYEYLHLDATGRNSQWVPGEDLIDQPVPMSQGNDTGYIPEGTATGWEGSVFNPEAFLSRPDIKALPLSTQSAMLDINQAYAELLVTAAAQEESITSQIETLKTIASSSLVKGFEVHNDKAQSIQPGEKVLLKFIITDTDIIGNVTASNLFTIQAPGSYNLIGDFHFEAASVPYVRFVELWINGGFAASFESDNVKDAVSVPVNKTITLKAGDVIQLRAFHLGPEVNFLKSGYSVSCLSVDSSLTPDGTVDSGGEGGSGGDPSGGTTPSELSGFYNWGVVGAGQKTCPAGINLGSLTAVYTNPDGKVLPIHPEINTAITPFFDGVTLTGAKANETITVALAYGQEYQITTTATIAPQAIQAGTPTLITNPTGAVDVAGTESTPTPKGNLIPGSLIYVGPAGILTQDYVYVQANCRWIVGVGRATATDKFIFEPHIPMDQQGGGGGGNFDVYTHTQSTPASVWNINHGLGRYVNVTVYDSDGDNVVRDLTFVDLDNVIVRLVVDTTGHAACS